MLSFFSGCSCRHHTSLSLNSSLYFLKTRPFTFIFTVQAGLPDSSVGKESACNAGDPSLIPGSGKSTAEGIGYPFQYCWASLVAQLVKKAAEMQETWIWSLSWEDPLEKGYRLQYSGLENYMDCVVHGVTKTQTPLSDFHFHFLLRLILNSPQFLCTSLYTKLYLM